MSHDPSPDDEWYGRQRISAGDTNAGHIPETWAGEERWYLSTVEEVDGDDRKKEIAPWVKQHPRTGEDSPPQARVSWKWDGVPTDLDTAQNWLDHLPGDYFLASYLPDRDDLDGDVDEVFIDCDNVRHPESGALHPTAAALIYYAESAVVVSQSGTGVHIYVRGDIPDGFDATLKGVGLADWPYAHDLGEPEIEIYGEKRFIAYTGDHVAGTPGDVRRNDAFVAALYETFDSEADDADAPDPSRAKDWDPEKDRETVRGIESTRDIEDIFDAIQHVTPDDIRLRSTPTDERPGGGIDYDPSYRTSKSGTGLGYDAEGFWYERKAEYAMDALKLISIEEGLTSWRSDAYPSGADFWDALDELRQRGAHIPEYNPGATWKAALPGVRDPNEWDWENGAQHGEEALTIDSARERTVETIEEIIEENDDALLNALPAMGKSFGTIRAAANTGEPMAFFTSRRDLYEQIREWCDEHGLSHYTLPSMPRDCPTANGECGKDWRNKVMEVYERGVRPKNIHAYLADILGHDHLPCQADGTCPYTARHDYDEENYDVLIGHYTHAHNENVVAGRVCVFDEYPEDTYTTQLGRVLLASIDHYLEKNDLPISGVEAITRGDYTDEEKEEVLAHIGRDPEPDDEAAMRNRSVHAAAPLATRAMLSRHGLGNGFEHAQFGHRPTHRAAYDMENGSLTILTPPDLTYSKATIALDGTPVKRMWEMCLGTNLNERAVLTDGERPTYIRNVLKLTLVQTTPHVKTYSSGKWVNPKADAALLEAIEAHHDTAPALITTKNAKREYDTWGESHETRSPLDIASDAKHYGAVKGTNDFETERVGAVIGSRHYGDKYVKLVGALYGTAVESPDRSDPDNRGANLSYGGFGDAVLTHMREHETLQSVLRFGRDAAGAAVYVHTNTLPDWVPVEHAGAVVKTWSDGMEEVLDAAVQQNRFTTSDIAAECSISRRQVSEHLNTLTDEGHLRRRRVGRENVYYDDGLDDLGENGDTDLSTFVDDGTDARADAETARMKTTYTWHFHVSAVEGSEPPSKERASATATDGGKDAPGEPPGS